MHTSRCARTPLVAVILTFTTSPLAAAPTIEVPTDQPTIAAAIANIDPGGVITLLPGDYDENVQSAGKDFTIRGTDPNDSATVAATRIAPTSGEAFRTELGSVVTIRGLSLYSPDDRALRIGEASDVQVLRTNITGNPGPSKSGGGVLVTADSTAEFRNSSIVNCTANGGGGLYLLGNTTIISCYIANNTAEANPGSLEARGGGILAGNAGQTLVINRSIIHQNTVVPASPASNFNEGGGIFMNRGDSITIVNSLIIGNSAHRAAAISSYENEATIVNCTIADNISGHSTFGSVHIHGAGYLTMYNSILYGNTDAAADPNDDISITSGVLSAVMEYNNIGSLAPSGTNISADPLFVNPGPGDYRLRPGSPSIDAGDSSVAAGGADLLGDPRLLDDTGTPDTGVGPAPVIDQGAYEFQGTTCPLDLNGDGILDNGDIGTFVTFFLGGNLAADFNGDGFLDNGDIGTFVNAFLAGC